MVIGTACALTITGEISNESPDPAIAGATALSESQHVQGHAGSHQQTYARADHEGDHGSTSCGRGCVVPTAR